MSDQHSAASEQQPLEEFTEQVKQALENLYDFPYLLGHPLAHANGEAADASREAGARRLRRDLIEAIEALNPGPDVSAQTPQSRIYTLLVLHYVEGRTVQEVAHDMGISERQAHRNLRQGEQSVAAILWSRRPPQLPQAPRARQLSSLQEEIDRLVLNPQPVDVYVLLQRARAAVQQQAAQRGVVLEVHEPPGPVIVSVDPPLAQQVLINALSHTLRQAQAGRLQVACNATGRQVCLALAYTPEAAANRVPAVGGVVQQLADRLGWRFQQEDEAGGTRVVTLRMAPHYPVVLVIDDNEGLVKLLNDYLTGHACQVIAADNGRDGLRLAQEQMPDAILLDVMIPGMDGWEVLQRLHNHPHTADIPVIICSVLDSPELAFSLGASGFLPKPISRDDVLNTLYELGVV